MYIPEGIKASELVSMLEQAIDIHGDKMVFMCGGEYPEGVESVKYIKPEDGDGYVPGDSFELW